MKEGTEGRMPDTKGRRKMISLRLSEAEYHGLKTQYQIHGARNVSDLARLALQRMMNKPPASLDAFAANLADLENRVRALESQLRTITRAY